MDNLIQEIIADLTTELKLTDSNFDSSLLEIKVKNATREVKQARRYPSSYTTTMIATDMERYYGQIRNIALYDYNNVGGEFQTSSSENSVTRQWVDRNSLFSGIIPLAKI